MPVKLCHRPGEESMSYEKGPGWRSRCENANEPNLELCLEESWKPRERGSLRREWCYLPSDPPTFYELLDPVSVSPSHCAPNTPRSVAALLYFCLQTDPAFCTSWNTSIDQSVPPMRCVSCFSLSQLLVHWIWSPKIRHPSLFLFAHLPHQISGQGLSVLTPKSFF